MNKGKIKTLLKKRIIILDGATGTELQKRGMPAGVCPERWCVENPEVIQAVQRDYCKAGADMVYTCTFGGNRLKLSEYGVTDVKEINRKLAVLSRQAVGSGVLVAGDIGPTGRFVEPFGDLPFEEAVAIFKEQVAGLLAGGVDLFVIETMMDIQEARAALLAVKETGDYFTIVTMTYEPDGRTLNGTDPVTALITLQSLGADAVGCNCSAGPEAMMEWISAMKPYATVPLAAKPNAGIPRLVGLTTTFDMDANAFGAFSKPFAAAGVNLLGGCCGTTPDHIGALKRELGGTTPVPPQRKSLAAVSSARGHAILDRDKPLYVIGERINPTGKKALQEELREGKTSLVRQMAREQEEQGADLLDVNVGVPGIDEPLAMKSLLGALAGTTGLPLVIDSPKVDTIAAALRLYPGRALLNSISGEREKMEKLLPLAARYGAMFILLPLLDGEIPETAAGRSKVVRDVYRAAQRHGFTKEDIIVDGLVMTVAANPNAPVETLKTVTWCSRTFGSRTVLGVSNVSFGMPERKWLNASFLVMAQAAGLSAAIVNPANLELTAMKKATDVFLGKDRGAAIYIESFREGEKTEKKPAGGAPLSPSEQVHQAIIAGNRDDIVGLIAGLMNSDSGLSAAGIVEKFMIPAILRVGDFYEQKTYFLPQLIASAEAMKKGLDHLEPLLREAKAQGTRKGVVLLATVQGDIHDIGKNIVALMLRNYGYDVIDLGKDVATKNVIEHIKKYRPDVVGLSALMTTTMIAMKDVMELARREGLTTPFILGGAVVTEAYATSLGAAYARDGVEAVRVLEKMLKQPNA